MQTPPVTSGMKFEMYIETPGNIRRFLRRRVACTLGCCELQSALCSSSQESRQGVGWYETACLNETVYNSDDALILIYGNAGVSAVLNEALRGLHATLSIIP